MPSTVFSEIDKNKRIWSEPSVAGDRWERRLNRNVRRWNDEDAMDNLPKDSTRLDWMAHGARRGLLGWIRPMVQEPDGRRPKALPPRESRTRGLGRFLRPERGTPDELARRDKKEMTANHRRQVTLASSWTCAGTLGQKKWTITWQICLSQSAIVVYYGNNGLPALFVSPL